MLTQELMFLHREEKESFEFLSHISDELVAMEYVKESFKEAILKREEVFPTGIGTENYSIAIPHTDSEHVIKPGIAFVRFNNKCAFKEMCTNNDLDVAMAFVLLVKAKEEQAVLLSKLMGLFTDNELLDKLNNENDCEIIVNILNDKLK